MSPVMRTLLLFCCFLMPVTLAQAADSNSGKTAPDTVIAIVDVQHILEDSSAAKSVQKQLEIQRAKFQTEIEGEENSLRQAEQDLSKTRDKISADVYTDREQQLRQRFLTVERHVQGRRKVLDQAFTDSMNVVRASLLEVVTAVAHEHGVNLVLVKQQVLWVDKPLDMTDEVLTRLNAKLPQLTVKMPAEESP